MAYQSSNPRSLRKDFEGRIAAIEERLGLLANGDVSVEVVEGEVVVDPRIDQILERLEAIEDKLASLAPPEPSAPEGPTVENIGATDATGGDKSSPVAHVAASGKPFDESSPPPEE